MIVHGIGPKRIYGVSVSKKTHGLTARERRENANSEAMNESHAQSISQFEKSRSTSRSRRGQTIRLVLIDVVLALLVGLTVLALMVFIQTVGVATLDVALTSGPTQPALSGIIFTSAVVGGISGAVVGWAPGMFNGLRRAVLEKIEHEHNGDEA